MAVPYISIDGDMNRPRSEFCSASSCKILTSSSLESLRIYPHIARRNSTSNTRTGFRLHGSRTRQSPEKHPVERPSGNARGFETLSIRPNPQRVQCTSTVPTEQFDDVISHVISLSGSEQ